jgi:hypothetical protein
MATQREVQETAARGLSVMVHYHNVPITRQSRELMIAEVQTIAAWAEAAGLDGETRRAGIVEPVQVGLLLRYSENEANRLLGEFVAAFDGARGLMLRKA